MLAQSVSRSSWLRMYNEDFEGGNSREWLHGVRRQRACYVVDRIESFKAIPSKIRAQHFWQFPRHKYASPQEISAWIGPAEFDETGNFGTYS